MIKNKAKGWNTGVVDIFDLKNMRIHLNPFFCKEIMNELHKFNTYTKIAKEITEPLGKSGQAHSLSNLKYTNSCSINLIKKVSDYLTEKGNKKFNLDKIKENIIAISSYSGSIKIKNPKFPFDFRNKYGAILISSLLHDGGITRNTFVCHYTNKELYLHKKIYACTKKVIGDFPLKLKKKEIDAYELNIPTTVGNILVHGLGMVPGNKVLNNPEIPEFIFKLSSKEKGLFLKQAFDDDGGICPNSSFIFISLTTIKKNKPSKILIGNKKLLDSLGILTSKIRLTESYFIKKDNLWRETWKFYITGRNNLNEFKNKVNFSIPRKRKNLEKGFENIKEEHFKHGKGEKIILNIMKSIEAKYGYFTRNLIAEEANRGWRRIQQIVPIFIKKGFIKEIEPYSGTKAAKFILKK